MLFRLILTTFLHFACFLRMISHRIRRWTIRTLAELSDGLLQSMLVKGPCGLFSRPVQGHRMDDNPLDDVDRSILHQLQLNARQTDTEIAEKVDVTSTTVRNRLDKLEGKGVIRGYHPEINY